MNGALNVPPEEESAPRAICVTDALERVHRQPHLGDVDAELGLLLSALAGSLCRRLRHLQLLLQLRHLPQGHISRAHMCDGLQ